MHLSKTGGSITTKYYYVGSQLVEMTQGSDKLHFTYDAIGPSAINYNGTQYYIAKNGQGDIVRIVNTSGTAVVTYTYDVWGTVTNITGSMASTLGTLNPFRYRGYVYDTETGLYYLQSRYYDPSMGRFISADGFTSTGQGALGSNMYIYCNNNPVNFIDPLGYSFKSWLLELLKNLGLGLNALTDSVFYIVLLDAYINSISIEFGTGFGLGGSVTYGPVEVSLEESCSGVIKVDEYVDVGHRYRKTVGITIADEIDVAYTSSFYHTDSIFCDHNFYCSTPEEMINCKYTVDESSPSISFKNVNYDGDITYGIGASAYVVFGGYYEIEWNISKFSRIIGEYLSNG